MKKYLYPAMVSCMTLGLLSLMVVMLTDAAYPSPIFSVGTVLGLGLMVLGLVLLILNWIVDVHRAVTTRQPLELLYLLVGAAVLLLPFFRR